MLGLVLLLLGADAPLKDAEGAVWKVEHGKREMLGGGMASRTPMRVLRNGRQVGLVETSSFTQENPRISGGTEWKFEIRDGVFEATGTSVRFEKEQRSETVSVRRWNGKELATAPAQSPRPRTSAP